MLHIDQQSISFNIFKARITANMSQTELIQRSGLSRNYISGLENNRGSIPSIRTLCKLADALGVEVDMLLYDNLVYYTVRSENVQLQKELQSLSVDELKFLLSLLQSYQRYKNKRL